MATVIFDFDSTLISCESLETMLYAALEKKPALGREYREITEAGIKGEISFFESLTKRLTLAAPTLANVEEFGKRASDYLTPGMSDLIAFLSNKGVEIWVISGGIYESIAPLCCKLGIDSSKILCVRMIWNRDGTFASIAHKNPFAISKVEGVRKLNPTWSKPTIAIGDAMSDYQLFLKGYVEHFILFTQHYRCKSIIDLGVSAANDAYQLKNMLGEILNDH
jgi:phosphoserine phosphatase